MYIWNPNVVITIPIDVPAPNSTRPSVVTMLAENQKYKICHSFLGY